MIDGAIAPGARFLARREEGAYRAYATDEQRRAKRPGDEKPSERPSSILNRTLALDRDADLVGIEGDDDAAVAGVAEDLERRFLDMAERELVVPTLRSAQSCCVVRQREDQPMDASSSDSPPSQERSGSSRPAFMGNKI